MDQLTFSSVEPPANLSRRPGSEREWQTLVATWPSSFSALLISLGPAGLFGRTSPASCRPTEGRILEASSGRWANSGMGGPIESWTLSSSEFPSAAVVSSLSGILETGDVPRRYCLSPKACAGILRRAKKRGKELPARLALALKAVVDSGQTST